MRIFYLYENIFRGMSTYPYANINAKKWISMFSAEKIVPRLVSFQMIFEALQSELFRFKFHYQGLKIQKNPEFNLLIGLWYNEISGLGYGPYDMGHIILCFGLKINVTRK